ncbi:hypothetical protein ABK751_21380, partial [Escherichia coli]|uniref:hypothetical protein n=1 Tax=Escherichia coli TaxID=562 RepID=UPI0037522BF6
LTFQNHTDCPLTDFGGKTSIFSHPVYLFLRKFSLQDSRGGSLSIHFSEDEIYEQDQSPLFSPLSTFLIDICLDICPARDGGLYY